MAREIGDRMDIPFVQSQNEAQRTSPEFAAGWLQTLTFGWLSPVVSEGYRRELQRQAGLTNIREPDALTESDLYELRPDDEPSVLNSTMEAAWNKELELPAEQRSLRRALIKAFGRIYFEAALLKFAYDSLQMVGPLVLKELLKYLHECSEHDVDSCKGSVGFKWIAVLCMSNLVQTAVLHQYFHRCFRTGMRVNAASIGLIYKKSLRIAGPGRSAESTMTNGGNGTSAPQQQRTSGEIVNLMAVDANRLQDTMPYLQILWSGPYAIIITLIFLLHVVKLATLAGLFVMMAQIPLVSMIARRVKIAQGKLMKVKDERIKITNELFGSIRLIKMYGWEDSFEKRLDDVRESEINYLRRYQALDIISKAMWTISPLLTSIATFAVYIIVYGDLTPGVAFSAMALFNVLRFPLTMLPNMVSSGVEANLAISRMEKFLCSPEIKGRSGVKEFVSDVETVPIRLTNASFEWPGGTKLLGDISFTVERASLTVIIGSVGVGKSGLLQVLTGDLAPSSRAESVQVNGSIAYSSQVAWIQNATIKDNIIFNHPYDADRYEAVVTACQLRPDFDALPSGEITEIGEKGVNLSGGQKQRVSLARAVYANAEILLLDDPLSAVDSEVAKKLMKMLRGPLVESSSIVLCTHYLGAIRHADQVIVLSRAESATSSTEATIEFQGTPDQYFTKYPDAVQGTMEVGLTRQASEELVTIFKAVKNEGRLIQAENEELGAVRWKVYKTYIDAAGGMSFAIMVLLGLVVGQGFQTTADCWVSYWSDHSKGVSDHEVSSGLGIGMYALTSVLAFGGIITASALFRTTAIRAARGFHRRLLNKLLALPMGFYDTTPMGRVISRFSKDIYTVDEKLISTLMMYFQVLCRVLATFVVISFATPWFVIVFIPLMGIYRWIQNYYVPSSRQMQRIESNLRSPIFSHFSETLDGVMSIRAFGQQLQFIRIASEKVHNNMRAYYMTVSSNRWLAVRLETVGTAIIAFSGIFAVAARNEISAGVAGLSISYALSVTQALNWVVRMTSDRETNIVSVERINEYIEQTCEPPRTTPQDPAAGTWPSGGAIEFNNVHLQYRPNLPFVLVGLNLKVNSGEKLGICGRTGAGKSSLLNVLLRIVDPTEGSILIDGVDLKQVGLHRLRKSITVLPQDPVLFSGSLRFNLDPLNESTDEAMWQALVRSHLATHVQALANNSTLEISEGSTSQFHSAGESIAAPGVDACLNALVAEKGENFSVGQRQQVCLARALLRSNRILLLDEATSAVDVDTDNLIQDTIRSEFAEHTVLCIAHRVSTVQASDRVCVVDGGLVVEIGPPKELMARPDSRFKRLAQNDSSR